MADVEIKGRISVDTGSATKSTNDYIDALKAAKKAVNEAKIGSVEYKKAQEDLAKATKDLDNSVAKSGGSFGKLKDTLGGVVPGFDGAREGASGFGKQLLVLAANPIVLILTAIVAACMLVYKAFASTNEGADKIDQVLAGLGATVEVLRDRILAVAGALGKFFSGDFKGAMEQGKAAVSGIGQEIADEFAAAAQATKTLQDLEDSMRAISVGRAELNRDLAKAKEIMSDADASAETRRKAINEVRAAEKKQSDLEVQAAKEAYEAIKSDNERSKNTQDEALNKQAAARVAWINLETQSNQNIRSLNKLENNLNREEQGKADTANKARQERGKAAREKEEKERQEGFKKVAADYNALNLELAAVDATGLEMLKALDAEKDRLLLNEIERGSSKMQIIKENYEAEKATDEAVINNKWALAKTISSIASTLSDELGKSTVAGKGLAIAGAIIDTWAAVAATLKAAAKTPAGGIPGYAIAQSIATGIAGLISVKKIMAVQVPGKSSGSANTGSMPSMPNAPLTPQPQRTSTTLDSNSIQGIGNAASGGVNRSFVLDSDITNNRERAERINRAARLG